MTVTITGVDDVIRDYARGSKALQSKMGLTIKEGAEAIKERIRQQIDMMAAIDTGTLWNSIEAVKVGPYSYNIGDLNYPMGVLPYGFFVEKGVLTRHFVPRVYFFENQKEGSKPQIRILELDNMREKRGLPPVAGLMVGPMAPRPYHSTAISSIKPALETFFVEEINKILPNFQGSLIIK